MKGLRYSLQTNGIQKESYNITIDIICLFQGYEHTELFIINLQGTASDPMNHEF